MEIIFGEEKTIIVILRTGEQLGKMWCSTAVFYVHNLLSNQQQKIQKKRVQLDV